MGTELQDKSKRYRIQIENIYKQDEKGFLLGLAQALEHIVNLEALLVGDIRGPRRDGSTEFISLLACICTDVAAFTNRYYLQIGEWRSSIA